MCSVSIHQSYNTIMDLTHCAESNEKKKKALQRCRVECVFTILQGVFEKMAGKLRRLFPDHLEEDQSLHSPDCHL